MTTPDPCGAPDALREKAIEAVSMQLYRRPGAVAHGTDLPWAKVHPLSQAMYRGQAAPIADAVLSLLREEGWGPRAPERDETFWRSVVEDAISDCSTVDFYDISPQGVQNMAMLAGKAIVRSARPTTPTEAD
jgi:hypothetical protein